MSSNVDINVRPSADAEIQAIADYVMAEPSFSEEAYDTARYCLMDTLGCGFLALRYPACAKHLGPVVPGTLVPNGARVPGTRHQLDPVKAAWDIGCMIRWLDFNDTWLAAEWGHPSDNLGGILAVFRLCQPQRFKPLSEFGDRSGFAQLYDPGTRDSRMPRAAQQLQPESGLTTCSWCALRPQRW